MARPQTYKHYVLVPASGGVDVLDPTRNDNVPLHRASNMNAAKRWVSAYRDGATWAVLAVLS